ncbi:cation diffusion facilitator family transporter [Actinoplanes sp. KI2]|uniref:cation diffusion facilitator family transporter n=1 Tax=Actinoplanes sp. KI2 TaxID=2983315 RepID=UPI0021D5D1D6|nr:cation diffusion facilitator family transporter [Actinoplanes sp. KI2]MCU7729396.1 cation diffusion facilitator family transporter [Actinoplanes sp. KI2]
MNLVAAIITLVALTVAARPADASHHYGHGKAEYFPAGGEGVMIFVAAGVILVNAVRRFIHPVPLDSLGLGVAISGLATVVNAAVGLLLIRVGRRERSVTLTADGKHLMTDVWTSAGVLAGVVLVGVTGRQRLDPVVGAVVGINILVTGGRLVAQSARALLDQSLGPQELAAVVAALDRFRSAEVGFHGLQTRESGRRRFVSMHVLVLGAWTVQAGHDLVEEVERAIREALPDTTVLTHLEPRGGPPRVQRLRLRGPPRSVYPTG